MLGRKPKPTAVRKMQGNPGRRDFNDREPKAKGRLVAAPEWMSESQKAGWLYAIENSPAGLLKMLDSSLLAIWVVAEDIHRNAVQKLALGLVTKSPRAGEPMQNPYLPIVNKQAMIMLKAASELGFTPSSRSRIVVDAEESDDPAEEYLN
jgi:P27 family predicted phage terminase small subunit